MAEQQERKINSSYLDFTGYHRQLRGDMQPEHADLSRGANNAYRRQYFSNILRIRRLEIESQQWVDDPSHFIDSYLQDTLTYTRADGSVFTLVENGPNGASQDAHGNQRNAIHHALINAVAFTLENQAEG